MPMITGLTLEEAEELDETLRLRIEVLRDMLPVRESRVKRTKLLESVRAKLMMDEALEAEHRAEREQADDDDEVYCEFGN